MVESPQPTILLIQPDDALLYLLERYARRGGFQLRIQRTEPTAQSVREEGASVIWFPSLQSLEGLRPRERGLVGDDEPLIVCAAKGDEPRARQLGADRCAVHPLTYAEFSASLEAVGVSRGHAA